MEKFLETVHNHARELQKRIIYPETFDPRTLNAVIEVVNQRLAIPILIGNEQEIQTLAQNQSLTLPPNLTYLDPKNTDLQKKFADRLLELRKEKGLTLEEANQWVKNVNYFGVMALEMGYGDGLISGANSTTGDTVRPALQIIKSKEKFHKVSGIFFMILHDRLILFADCAINIDPNSHDLADIAIDTAETAKRFGITPKVAMLSFSTHGSAHHPMVEKVQEAVNLIKERHPELLVEGEMQVDAALVPEVAAKKYPESKIQGTANILIFPDLQSGNIAYKLVERLAQAKAIGPVLQGLKKPVNDLSRGCSTEDIINLTAITACEADEIDFQFPSSLVE